MLDGDIHGEEAAPEDDELRQGEEEAGAADMNVEQHEEEDVVELDLQEQAMLDLLQLCQDAGTSLQFFDKLVTILRRHGKKGFDI
jgi:hypothetical protein